MLVGAMRVLVGAMRLACLHATRVLHSGWVLAGWMPCSVAHTFGRVDGC